MPWAKVKDGEFAVNPSLQRVKIRRLERLISETTLSNVANINDYMLKNRIDEILDGFGSNLKFIGIPCIFRASRNTSNEPFSNFSRLWYPPAEVTRMGRLNRPRQPILYASQSLPTALREVRAEEGQLYTISVYKGINLENPARYVRLGHIEGSEMPITATTVDRRNAHFRDSYTAQGVWEKWLAIDDMITKWMAFEADTEQQEHLYRLTNMIFDHLKQMIGCEGAIYPSVAAGSADYNVAVKVEFFHNFFVPAQAVMGRVHMRADDPLYPTSDNVGRLWFEPILQSDHIGDDGEIAWKSASGMDAREVGSQFFAYRRERF